MRFVDEFRSGELAHKLSTELAALVESGRTLKIMEVCGGHTPTIYQHGIEDLVPPEIDFVHGPGCPSASSRWEASTTRSRLRSDRK